MSKMESVNILWLSTNAGISHTYLMKTVKVESPLLNMSCKYGAISHDQSADIHFGRKSAQRRIINLVGRQVGSGRLACCPHKLAPIVLVRMCKLSTAF